MVERASESNILLVEDYLSRNPVGDQGEATNRHRQPAARFSTLVVPRVTSARSR